MNFEVVTNTATIDVIKLPQAISFDRLPDRNQDDPPFILVASSDSGLAVTFSILSGPATIVGNLLSLSGSHGIVIVQANQSGSDEYDTAPPVERSFVVLGPSSITITEHPHSQFVAEGERVVLTVAAEGPALTYQWQSNGSNIVGATSASLTLNAASQASAGSYRVIVKNAAGTAASNEAVVSVRPKLNVQQVSGQITLRWGFGILQTSNDLRGWEDVNEAAPPFIPSGTEPNRFYRIRD